MDTIRLFLRSNSFRNTKIRTDLNSKSLSITSNIIDKDNNNLLIENDKNEILIRRSSSNEKLSRDNVKSFLSTHPSSSSLSSNFQSVSSQIGTCFGLSSPSSNNKRSPNIVASASAAISNVRSFTNENPLKDRRIRRQRRHSWTNERNFHNISSSSSSFAVRQTKSHRYSDRTRNYSFIHKNSTKKTRRRIIQPFQSTYRQRNEEFRKVFKDLPNDERLIVDYSCAWQKEILIQGRMYISQNYLCFYANFLKWETSLCLKFKDISSLTREKTAKVIPNAIEIKTNKNERYFFSSFATRDKTYAMIFRIWQTVSIDQPISSQQLWTMIHQSYGNDLDMTTDEEDTYNKQSTNSTPDKSLSKQLTKNETNEKYCSVTPNSICSKSSEKEEIDDRSSLSSRGGRPTDDDNDNDDDNESMIPIGEEANSNTLIRQPSSNTKRQENCLASMEAVQERNYLSKCSCESHLATQLIDRTYSLSVERLFDYLFGENDFVNAYHESRRIKDFHTDEWKINEKTGKRERVCTYKVSVTAVFGETTICSNEKQVIICELSKSHYIVDTEVRNEGIKYADAFFVASRYCLVQVGPNKSHLKVTCEVRYVRSLMIIIKSFIEKNAMAALQDSYTDLIKRIEVECSNRQRSSNIIINNNNEQDKTSQSIQMSKKKYSQKQQSMKLNSTMNDSSPDQQRKQIIHDETIHHNQSPKLVISSTSNYASPSGWPNNNIFIPFCLIIMLILLSVNIFLWLKLNQIDRMTDRLVQNYPLWSDGYSYPKEEYQWSLLLKRQEEYYQTKLNGLRSVLILTHNALKNVTDALNELTKVSILILTHNALKNVTDALNELTKVSSRTNSNAPIDHLHSS
ncbi:unnamed protein product [Rotaria socialis]